MKSINMCRICSSQLLAGYLFCPYCGTPCGLVSALPQAVEELAHAGVGMSHGGEEELASGRLDGIAAGKGATTSTAALLQPAVFEQFMDLPLNGSALYGPQVRRDIYDMKMQQAFLQLLLDKMPCGVFLLCGSEGRLLFANRASQHIWRAVWQRNQPLGQFLAKNGLSICSMNGKQLDPHLLGAMQPVLSGKAVHQHRELLCFADGAALPILVDALPLNLNLGIEEASEEVTFRSVKEPMALVVCQDVSALQAEESLRDEFIGIAVHELRSPIAILKGFVRLLTMYNEQETTAWQKRVIGGIDHATKRLVELTEDLLDVIWLQTGRFELHCEQFDLLALARRVIAHLQMTAPHHTISLRAGRETFTIQGDARRIEQIVSNLLNNSIKYSPAGGPIEIVIVEEEGQALFSVRDQGIGIPACQQEHIFESFVRADNALLSGISGTGLGLYLCRILVERHQGDLWFESVEEQGSTFYLALPLAKTH